MESLAKNIVNNTVPPLKAVSENGSNHLFIVCTSYLILGLLVGALTTTLVINSLKLKKHLAEQKLKENGNSTT